ISPSPQTLSRGKACWSSSTTSTPARASTRAQALPAGPAPTTSTSQRAGTPAAAADRESVIGIGAKGDARPKNTRPRRASRAAEHAVEEAHHDARQLVAPALEEMLRAGD